MQAILTLSHIHWNPIGIFTAKVKVEPLECQSRKNIVVRLVPLHLALPTRPILVESKSSKW